jgi:CRP-like cAMP-binding protein
MEFFNVMWSTQSIDQQTLMNEMPPTMRATVCEFLYKRFLSSIPLFRGLSAEVIAGLSFHMRPLTALKNQIIMEEGQSGEEMYLVISGEVEVLSNKSRLGFLSEGAFFGEISVLDDSSGSRIRTRTVRSVTDSTELCYITADSMTVLQDSFPELKARMKRFMRGGESRGQKLSRKSLRQVGLTRVQVCHRSGQSRRRRRRRLFCCCCC